MNRFALVGLLAFTLAAPGFAQDSRPTSRPTEQPGAPRKDCTGSYGAGLKDKSARTVTLAALIKNPKAFEGKTIRVTAKIEDVCTKKGCWMVLVDGKNHMRVRFKDYKFFVPKNSAGYIATVEGTAKLTTISEEMAKHYAEESGDKEAAKAIKGPQTGVAFTATGVTMVKAPKKG